MLNRCWCCSGSVGLVGWYLPHGRDRTCALLLSSENIWNILPLEWNVFTCLSTCSSPFTRDKGIHVFLLLARRDFSCWLLCKITSSNSGTKFGRYRGFVQGALVEENRPVVLLKVAYSILKMSSLSHFCSLLADVAVSVVRGEGNLSK